MKGFLLLSPTMPFGFGFNLNLNFNLFNNEEANARKPTTERNVITFEEGLKTLQEGIVKLFNILEGLEPNFTPEEHIMLYTTVYNLCSPNSIPSYDLELYNLYKQICEDYITSKVLPSLQEKKDETLLTILLERWSNYKIMTKRLASFFSHLDRFFLQRYGYPNLEKTSFLSFYHLVYEEMNQEIMDAISAAMVYDEEMHQEIKDDMSAMIDRKLAGEKFEYTFVINTLDFYLRFDECTRKNRKMDVLSKKLNLISPDGAVFEVDYDVALMSSRFNNILETIPVGDVGNIYVNEVSSIILNMVIEYCKKEIQNKDLEDEFVNVDLKTLIDLTIAACYLKVHSLVKLSWSKVDNLLKGKTPEEISQIFGAADRRLKLGAIRREQGVESFNFSCFGCNLDTIYVVDSKMLPQ